MSTRWQEYTEDTRESRWMIVLNEPHENPTLFNIKAVFKELKINYKFVALILHDKDMKKDLQEKETPHIQGIIETHRTRKGTLIKNLGQLLKYPEELISVRPIKNWRKACRYLLHMDEEEEYQNHYEPFEIITNDEEYYFDSIVEVEENLSELKIIRIVKENNGSIVKIVKKIGEQNYNKHSRLINALIREMRD